MRLAYTRTTRLRIFKQKLLLTITYFSSFAVSRWDRLLVFGGLNLAALAMFATCFALMFTPIFLVKPRKFAIL